MAEQKPTLQEMLDMELHHMLRLDRDFTILRVPGGWIYEIIDAYNDNNDVPIINNIFVPEPSEPKQKIENHTHHHYYNDRNSYRPTGVTEHYRSNI